MKSLTHIKNVLQIMVSKLLKITYNHCNIVERHWTRIAKSLKNIARTLLTHWRSLKNKSPNNWSVFKKHCKLTLLRAIPTMIWLLDSSTWSLMLEICSGLCLKFMIEAYVWSWRLDEPNLIFQRPLAFCMSYLSHWFVRLSSFLFAESTSWSVLKFRIAPNQKTIWFY